MAFELWIQRFLDDHSSAALVAGADIGELEFHALMQDPSFTNIPGTNTYRMMHYSGVPWLLFELDTPLETPSRVRLSISYTNFRFARVFNDVFDLGLGLAKHLNAHLVDENNRLIEATQLDELLNPDGEYVQTHLKRWQDSLSEINMHNQAPLEFPLGHVDSVREYFCLSVLPAAETNAEQISEQLGYAIRFRNESHTIGAIYDPDTQRLIAKILFRADGKIQIQPFYWKEPFAKAAAETMAIAESIAEKFDGQLFFFTQPVSTELLDTLRNRINALGVDFYWWVGEYFRKVHA